MTDEKRVEQNSKNIEQLKISQAEMNVKMDAINQSIGEIKNNHLLHINDELTEINKMIVAQNTNFSNQIAGVYAKISELKIVDARQEQPNRIVGKVVEYVLLAVLAAILSLVLIRNT